MTAAAPRPTWIIFDFGGCLDSDGIHSRTLFLRAFKLRGLVDDSRWTIFQDAYTKTDRKIVHDGLTHGETLRQMNDLMCRMIADNLALSDQKAVAEAARDITGKQAACLRRNKAVLTSLKNKFRLGIISNFYGNLDIILKEFGLYNLFDFILDSYHVGYHKPDPRIFETALKLTGETGAALCFMGDNPERDIRPARKLGMKTILIYDRDLPQNDGGADFTVKSFPEILTLTNLIAE